MLVSNSTLIVIALIATLSVPISAFRWTVRDARDYIKLNRLLTDKWNGESRAQLAKLANELLSSHEDLSKVEINVLTSLKRLASYRNRCDATAFKAFNRMNDMIQQLDRMCEESKYYSAPDKNAIDQIRRYHANQNTKTCVLILAKRVVDQVSKLDVYPRLVGSVEGLDQFELERQIHCNEDPNRAGCMKSFEPRSSKKLWTIYENDLQGHDVSNKDVANSFFKITMVEPCITIRKLLSDSLDLYEINRMFNINLNDGLGQHDDESFWQARKLYMRCSSLLKDQRSHNELFWDIMTKESRIQ